MIIDQYEKLLRQMEEQDSPIVPLYGVIFLDNHNRQCRVLLHDRRDVLNLMRSLNIWGISRGAVMCYWEDESVFDHWREGQKALEQYDQQL